MTRHPLSGAYWALAAVCFFWGTTYVAIRMALESFPPLTLVSVRFLLSGGILLAWALITGQHFPSRRELLRTSLNGVITIGVGNACVVIAETRIASGLAALFITTSPFYMVGIESLIPGGAAIHAPTIGGMVIGFLGAGLLVTRGASGAGSGHEMWGFLLLQLGNLGWAYGSIRQRRVYTTVHPVLSGAFQQLATGLFYIIPAMLLESAPVRWNARGVMALFYLVTFGSIVGYSAYLIAMERLPVAVVSLYTYINPIVAVSLGWLLYQEPFGLRECAAMAVIFLGVWMVKRFGQRPAVN